MRCTCLLMIAEACTLHVPHTAQNLKPHSDENEDSDNDSKFDAFAEELDQRYHLIPNGY